MLIISRQSLSVQTPLQVANLKTYVCVTWQFISDVFLVEREGLVPSRSLDITHILTDPLRSSLDRGCRYWEGLVGGQGIGQRGHAPTFLLPICHQMMNPLQANST